MSSGLPSPEPPSENTLTINITHEQLKILEEMGFEEVVAVSPTRLKEGDYAYDVAMDWKWAKAFYQQFKRPHAETGSIANHRNTENHVKFNIDDSQLQTLREMYGPGISFLTFPLVRDRREMPRNLSETFFVDVHGVEMESPTIAYIREDWNAFHKTDFYLPDIPGDVEYWCFPEGCRFPKAVKKENCNWMPVVQVNSGDSIKTVDPEYVMDWEELLGKLLSCDAGVMLRMLDDIAYLRNEETQSPSAAMVFGGQELPESAEWS